MKKRKCPACGAGASASSTPDGERGSFPEGAIMICFYCAAVNVIEKGVLRRGTDADIAALTDEEREEVATIRGGLGAMKHGVGNA